MYYIHVNRGVIDSNRKNNTDKPAISYRKGKRGKAVYAHEIIINGPSKVIYSAHEPILPCGARMVITTENEPTIVK